MKLREHPGMSFHGIPNWPPVWTRSRKETVKTVRGEVGILTYVFANEQISNKCYLVIDHEQNTYVGCLIFDDSTFCRQIAGFLRAYLGRPISEIGDLDIGHTL